MFRLNRPSRPREKSTENAGERLLRRPLPPESPQVHPHAAVMSASRPRAPRGRWRAVPPSGARASRARLPSSLPAPIGAPPAPARAPPAARASHARQDPGVYPNMPSKPRPHPVGHVPRAREPRAARTRGSRPVPDVKDIRGAEGRRPRHSAHRRPRALAHPRIRGPSRRSFLTLLPPRDVRGVLAAVGFDLSSAAASTLTGQDDRLRLLQVVVVFLSAEKSDCVYVSVT